MGLVCFSAHTAAAPNAISLGSFLNQHHAESKRNLLSGSFNAPVHVVKTQPGASIGYRVVVLPTADVSLDELLQQAQNQGIKDAWRVELTVPKRQPLVEVTTTDGRKEADPGAADETLTSPTPTLRPTPAPQSTPAPSPNPADLESITLSRDGTDVRISIPKLANTIIELDGHLDETFWDNIPFYDNMTITDPDTMGEPAYPTKMHFFYTDQGMYIGVDMQQPPETLIARLSSRDEFLNRDSWGITLDTSGEGLYGYWFTVNLGGSVMDGKIVPERQYSNEWDGPWQSATAELTDGWSTEIFLPWSMMTMPASVDGSRNFGFWVNRKVAHRDERWSWPALPFESTRFMSVLAQMETPGVEPRGQLEVYPNVAYTLDEIDSEDEYRAGLDISWRPSSNMQLTATLNPDFGVVESDDVVINLSAFETFFPEKRLFFLEGSEVFQTTPRSRVRSRSPGGSGARRTTSTFNPEPTTLLNTRRIGGPPRIDIPDNVDVAGVERGKPSDLLGAVKLTGQSGPIRYGVLSAFEDEVRLPGTIESGLDAGRAVRVEGDGRNFGVARILYETTGQGRQSIGYLGTIVDYEDSEAIVHGIDHHWLSPNGLWQMDTQFMHSDVDDVTGSGALVDLTYKPKQGVQHVLTLDYLEDSLNVRDLGFIRRNDSRNVIYRYSYSTGQGLRYLRSKSRSIVLSNEWNQDGRHVRAGYFFRNGWMFKNRSAINTEFDYFPARWDDRNSFGNGDFKVEDRFVAEVSFGTDTSKPLSFSALIGVRQEELSDWTIRSAMGVTYKPNDRFSLELDLNYFDRDGWLLHQRAFGQDDPAQDRNMTTFKAQSIEPRLAIDWFLSAKQQIRLTMQWAGIQAQEQDLYIIPLGDGDLVRLVRAPSDSRNDFTVSRLTTQLRYRWEIGPLSDLFVVYTRGSNVPNQVDGSFGQLYSEALNEPIVDLFVIKLRYRFGL